MEKTRDDGPAGGLGLVVAGLAASEDCGNGGGGEGAAVRAALGGDVGTSGGEGVGVRKGEGAGRYAKAN